MKILDTVKELETAKVSSGHPVIDVSWEEAKGVEDFLPLPNAFRVNGMYLIVHVVLYQL